MNKDSGFSRRKFIKATRLVALGTNVAGGLAGATSAQAGTAKARETSLRAAAGEQAVVYVGQPR